MPDCASEMDQHTPASSGYTHKAPAGNLSSGENSNIRTQCLIAGKTQTNTHTHSFSVSSCLVSLTYKCRGVSLLSELNPDSVMEGAMEGRDKYNLQASLIYTLVS